MAQKLLGVIAATGIGVGLFAMWARYWGIDDKISIEEWGMLAGALVIGSAIGIVIGAAANKSVKTPPVA